MRLYALGQELNGVAINVNASDSGAPNARLYTFHCLYCQSSVAITDEIRENMEESIGVMLQDLDQSIKAVNGTVVGTGEMIQKKIGVANEQVKALKIEVEKNRKSTEEAAEWIENIDGYRAPATYGLSALPVVLSLLYLISLCCSIPRSNSINKFNFHFLLPLISILFLSASIHIFLSRSTADSCLDADHSERHLSLSYSPLQASILSACLTNTSLLDAMNISSTFDFTNAIRLPDATALKEGFSSSQFNQLAEDVNGLDLDTFHYNGTVKIMSLNELNQILAASGKPVVSYGGVEGVDYAQFTPVATANHVRELRNNIITALTIESQLNSFLFTLRSNVSSLSLDFTNLNADALQFSTSLAGVRSGLDPLLLAGKKAVNAAYCGSLGEDYNEAKKAVCETGLQGIGMLALVSLVSGLLGLIAACCSERVSRTELPGGQHEGSTDAISSNYAQMTDYSSNR